MPSVDIISPPIPVDGSGEIVIPTTWPRGLPTGVSLVMQYWIQDPGGPIGWAVSNGLVATMA